MGPSPSITLRSVTPADAAAWETLRDALWPGEHERHARDIASFFAGILNEPIAVLLAQTLRGEIVGLVELSIRSDIPGLFGQKTGYIEGLYVHPSYRFQGIANRLVEASKLWARQTGCQSFASDRDDRVIADRSFSNRDITAPS